MIPPTEYNYEINLNKQLVFPLYIITNKTIQSYQNITDNIKHETIFSQSIWNLFYPPYLCKEI